MTMVNCKNCGNSFERAPAAGRTRVHCSSSCRRRYSKRAERTRLENCMECGGAISQPAVGAAKEILH